MKRTIIFLTVFAFVIFGLIAGTRDAQTAQRPVDTSIIKIHFPQPECYPGGWYGKVRLASDPWTNYQCGPTTCTCGPTVPEGTYNVWGEKPIDCRRTDVVQVYHPGYGITDVYLVINGGCPAHP